MSVVAINGQGELQAGPDSLVVDHCPKGILNGDISPLKCIPNGVSVKAEDAEGQEILPTFDSTPPLSPDSKQTRSKTQQQQTLTMDSPQDKTDQKAEAEPEVVRNGNCNSGSENGELETNSQKLDSNEPNSSPVKDNNNDGNETPYKTRYGRVQKKNSSPDMEMIPLVHKRRSKEAGKDDKSKSVESSPSPVLNSSSNSNPTSESSPSSNPSPSPSLSPNSESSDKDLPPEWLVGDLLWSKITGYPWWPCMVSFDPLLGIYTKIRATDKTKVRMYHVQYFGPQAERSWIAARNAMPFEGRQKFDEWLKKGAPKNENKAVKRKGWDIAVLEAEDALTMTRTERKQKLTFEYIKTPPPGRPSTKGPTPKTPNQTVKRKADPSPSTPTISEPKLKKAKESPLITENGNNGEITFQRRRYRPNRSKPKGSFIVFAQKHSMVTKMENPELTDEEIQELLLEMWDNMDEDCRARYVGRFSENMGGPPPPKKKPIKPKLNGFLKPVSDGIPNGGKPSGQTLGKKDESNEPSEYSWSDTSSIQDLSDVDAMSSTSTQVSRAMGDKLCFICEKTGEVIPCKGTCHQTFHLDCLGLTQAPAEFICDTCTSGKLTCFSCKEFGVDELVRCSVANCGKAYHMECLQTNPLTQMEKQNVVCPLHTCLTCYAEDEKTSRSMKRRLTKCIRCPVAYHTHYSCVAAGSLQLTLSYLVCPRHYQPKKGRNHLHLSAGWCFICSKGGSLICCESCPASFHAECLEIDPPEGSYYCEDCQLGKHPRYGDIVWVKLGTYRWWPAKVCHPDSVPENVRNLSHDIGEFPVMFFGSHDYYWIHRGRVFQFQEGDGGGSKSSNKHVEKVFKKALDEAVEEFKKWKDVQAARMAAKTEKVSRPLPYKHIKVNKPVGKVQPIVPNMSGLCQCDCEATMDQPCGPSTDCINRVLMFECHPDLCPAGEHCQNQRFQRRQYVPCEYFKTDNRGWGLRTLVDIKKDQFVIEYVGELIDEDEYERRMKKMNESKDMNFYFLTIEKDRIIDAGPKGNLARFMNHSCDPNCETQKWMVHGDTRVGLFALRDIPAGSELTFNYNLDCRGNEKTPCSCGAENCSGFIGVRPKQPPRVASAAIKRRVLKRKKRKQSIEKSHEDDCFRCGEGGELVMCCKKGCPKSYHLKCLDLAKRPYGKWECPWHHCDVCGKASSVLCDLCPNSFCKEHSTDENIALLNENFHVCHEHGGEDISSDTCSDLTEAREGSGSDEGEKPKRLRRAQDDDSAKAASSSDDGDDNNKKS